MANNDSLKALMMTIGQTETRLGTNDKGELIAKKITAAYRLKGISNKEKEAIALAIFAQLNPLKETFKALYLSDDPKEREAILYFANKLGRVIPDGQKPNLNLHLQLTSKWMSELPESAKAK